MSKVLLLGILACAVASGIPRPAAACDAADAEVRTAKIRALLDREATRARRWNVGWGIGFGAVTAGQLGLTLADWSPLGDYTDDTELGLYVASGKAGIGMLSKIILPLKIVRPGAPTGDPCADLDAAERALRESGKNERRSFYLSHLGGLAMNVAAFFLLGSGFDTWREAWIGLAIGYPVGLLHVYTQPRRAWSAARSLPVDVSVSVTHNQDAWGLAIAGAF